MEEEIIKKYKKAGDISKEAKKFARKELKPGVRVEDLADSIEKFIQEKNGGLAFPTTISINDIAAHYAPDIKDPLTIKDGDLVKVDLGVHIDGYIADTAFSVCVGEKSNELIKAAEDTLKKVLKLIKPGVTVEEISGLIEDSVQSYGLNPIRNLAGHSIERYREHGDLSIPNGRVPIKEKLKEDQVLGMEIFTTSGEGMVIESSPGLIYRFLQARPVRLRESRKILELISKKFKTLPFARRWLKNIGTPIRLQLALRELVEKEILHEYPPLRERSHQPVAQAEETIIVLDKPIITTKIED